MEKLWIVERQVAGPLVKECRSLRPRFSRFDTPEERKAKEQMKLSGGDSSVCRSPTERLEIRLAMFGFEGVHYTLTFDNENLPPTFNDVRRAWRKFFWRLRRLHKEPFDYIYAIEGLHGDRRYHIHAILRRTSFTYEEIQSKWTFGGVHFSPLLKGKGDCYYRTARYLTKERPEGVIIPIDGKQWVCSRSINQMVPPVKRWESTESMISYPAEYYWICDNPNELYNNSFGKYRYVSYIKQWGEYNKIST